MTHSAGASPTPMAGDPADFWHSLLRPEFDRAPDFAGKFFARLRDAKLVFGGRVHCPFLRPFFLTEEDETRVRVVAETIAALGERVVVAALENRALFEQLHLRPEEERLARIPVGYARASTASRLAMITCAPAPASSRATMKPRPLFAPVTIAVRPC